MGYAGWQPALREVQSAGASEGGGGVEWGREWLIVNCELLIVNGGGDG